MKKLIKIFLVLCIIAVVLLAGTLVTLKIMFPFAKLKSMAQEYVTQNYNREVDLKDISFNLIGVTLENFKLSEDGGFAKGTFVSADTAIVKVEFMPLFKKQIKISTIGFDGVNINIVKGKDGKFNFNNLVPVSAAEVSPQPVAEQVSSTPLAMDLTARDIYIKNSDVSYKDLQSGMDFDVEDVNFSIKDFDYNNPFGFLASFKTDIDTGDVKLSPVEISSEGTVNIAGMQLAKASVNVKNFAVTYKNFKVNMAGSVNDLENPILALKGTISGIDNKLAADFVSAQMPAFALPVINIDFGATANLEASNATVNKFDITLGKSYIKTNANVDFSKEELAYSSNTTIDISLSDIANISKELLAAFKLKGAVSGNIKTVSAKDMPLVKGAITFKDLGADVMGKTLSTLNGVLTINSIDDIKTNIIKGIFGGSNFKTSVAYLKTKRMSVDFMFDMDKFTLDDIDFNKLMASSNKEKVVSKPADKQAQTPASDLKMDPMDVKADVAIRRVENNIFSTDNLSFKADIKNLDLTMSKAVGTVYFASMDGEIKDLDTLINSSVFLKVILTSVKIAQKALKTMEIVSGGQINTDSVSYKSIVGDYTLNDGIATIKKSDLVSDLVTIKTTGTVNFVTEKLDMRINTGLGKNATGSAAIKVTGTINNPSFKLDISSTVSSLLGRGKNQDTKQAVADVQKTVKDVTSGIKNLFKKK